LVYSREVYIVSQQHARHSTYNQTFAHATFIQFKVPLFSKRVAVVVAARRWWKGWEAKEGRIMQEIERTKWEGTQGSVLEEMFRF